MPVAESFNALGRGNGFPSCLTKVDVSSKALWTTLGGNQRGGSVTEAGKGLDQAMAFFWNVEEFIFSATATRKTSSTSATATVTNYSTEGEGGAIIPVNRVCGSLSDLGKSDSDIDSPSSATASFTFATNNGQLEIARLYDGITSSEDNFVGYGFLLDTTGFLSDQEIRLRAQPSRGAASIVTLKSALSSSTGAAYCSISSNIGIDFHFTCFASGTTTDPSDASASTSQGTPPNTFTSSAVFNSLGFYTYPA